MLLDNYKKESPIVGVAGLGGGINSYIFLSSGEDYVISKSLRFNSADTPKLTRDPSSASNRKTWTLAFWIKRTTTGSREQIISAAGSNNTYVEFQSDKLMIEDYNPGINSRLWTTRVFRDPSAWYHIVIAMDTTQGTSSNRLKLYVNGVQETVFDTATYPGPDYLTSFNNTGEHKIGQFPGNTNFPLNAYLADFHLVDGQQLAPTDFGKFNDAGVWQPKKFSGSHGTNGFHLDFKDSSSIGNDAAGSNNWTATNITASVPGLATANQGFDVVTYTGNAGTKAVTGLAFQPDLLWLKRVDGAAHHYIVDVVRGLGTSERLASDSTDAAGDGTQRVSSFNSDGFTVSGNYGYTNISGGNYVAWAWKAGGAAVLNEAGTIDSQVSASTAYGFSVVSYTGSNSVSTVGHGLDSAPGMYVVKRRTDAGYGWIVYHSALGASNFMAWQNTSAAELGFDPWNQTAPTSSVFTVNTTGSGTVNAASKDYVAYVWSEVAGFSKFGSYSGTGTGGNKVTTGFKPKFVIIKSSSTSSGWGLYQEGVTGQQLMANCNGEEGVRGDCQVGSAKRDIQANVTFNSDGFTLSSGWTEQNASGSNYIYAAFASKPDGSGLDVLIDSPSQSVADETDTGLGGQITGNYATLNPLNKHNSNNTLSNGNLEFTTSGSDGCLQESTIGMSSGKFYFEVVYSAGGTGQLAGIRKSGARNYDDSYIYTGTANKYTNGGSGASYGAGLVNGDVIGTAFDADNGTLTFYRNGLSQGQAFSGISGTYSFLVGSFGGPPTGVVNFGQRAFAYQNAGTNRPSADYKSLCTVNLTPPTIADGSKYFDVATDTGANILSAATAKTDNAGFVWIKDRDNNSTNHIIFNKINDVGMDGTPHMRSNETDNEATCGTYSAPSGNSVGWVWDAGDAANPTTIAPGGLNSSAYNDDQTWSGMCSPTPSSGTFASGFDGSLTTTFAGGISAGAYFTFTPTGGISFSNNIRVYNGAVSGASYKYNGGSATSFPTNSWTTVASGGGTMTSFAVTRNTTDVHGWYAIEVDGKILVDDGASPPNVPSIESTIKANQTAGFSICTYSGSGSNGTWAHGLLTAPDLIIVKCRNVAQNWAVQHSALGPTQYAYLNTTNNFRTSSGTAFWNDTAPTNTTVSVGTDNDTNSSGKTYVAFSFSTIPGYSSFGKYTGNGDADGIYIYTGFSPRWLLFKRSDSTSDWSIYDTARDPHNVAGDKLEPNTSDGEDEQGTVIDILSNGFKFRRNSLENGGNDVYVYAAFASHPFNTSRAR